MYWQFWNSPNDWPHDPPAHVFLARAFGKIGRAMFGGEWDSKGDKLIKPEDVDEDDWEEIEDERDRVAEEKLKQMQETVWKEIAGSCATGVLVTALRPLEGGKMTDLKKHYWNLEKYWPRFERCQMTLDDPFSDNERAGSGTHWIYVKQDSLDQYLSAQPYVSTSLTAQEHLSPYLKLMIWVSKDMNITRDHQPKKEELIAVLRNKWTGQSQLSDNIVNMMATLLREPESQAGSASMARRKARGVK